MAAFTLYNESFADFVMIMEHATEDRSCMSEIEPSSAVTDQFHSLML